MTNSVCWGAVGAGNGMADRTQSLWTSVRNFDFTQNVIRNQVVICNNNDKTKLYLDIALSYQLQREDSNSCQEDRQITYKGKRTRLTSDVSSEAQEEEDEAGPSQCFSTQTDQVQRRLLPLLRQWCQQVTYKLLNPFMPQFLIWKVENKYSCCFIELFQD